jgi:hypothetical protein
MPWPGAQQPPGRLFLLIDYRFAPTPISVSTPRAANTMAAVMRIAFTGSLSASLLARNTAGTLASIMPSVVPVTTGKNCSNRAASPRGRDLRLVTDLGEEERDLARDIATTDAYITSRRERK